MKRKLFKVLLSLLLTLLIGSTASGNTITVKNTNDSGPGSLRDAIASASSGDTINFKLIYPTTITLTTGTLNIATSLTISGPGASKLAIDGNNAARVINVSSGVTVRISGVTIRNGNCMTFHCLGGGVLNYGRLTLDNVTVSGSSAFDGGGVMSYDGTLTLTNSTAWGNRSDSIGGGVFNACPSSVTVTNSTIWGNSSGEHGGGLASYDCTLTVINSTVYGNLASDGGGIFNYYASTLTVANSTISGNSASFYGAIYNWGGTIALKNTILANSSGGNCGSSGPATSDGHNLSDDTSCSSFLTATSDLNNTAAELDPSGLQENGGPTKTIALLATSYAVDAIPVPDCTLPDGKEVVTDQRGIIRPEGLGCDIGAFEFVAFPFSSFTAKLDIHAGSALESPREPAGFDLNAKFTAGSSDGINPLTKDVHLLIGTYDVLIPADSFTKLKHGAKIGSYVFSGMAGGVWLSIQIVPLGANTYEFKAEGSPVDLTALPNPIAVSLTIGNNAGTTSVNADHRHRCGNEDRERDF